MDSKSRTISVTANSDDVKALGAIGRMFLDLAGEPAVFVTAVEPGTVLHENLDTAGIFAAIAAPPTTPPPAAACAVPTPPAAPQPPTPPQAPTPPPAPAAGPLDKNGLPWDARINTSNKAQTQAGVWKRVPKISDEVYAAVLAELRSTVAAIPPLAQPAAAPAVPPAGAAAPMAAPTAAPPAPTPHVAPAPPEIEEVPTTYATLLGAISKRLNANKITHDEINGVCVLGGLTDLNSVASADPAFVPWVYGECKKIWDTRA